MLTNIFDSKLFTTNQVVYFTAPNYPFNFFKLFFNFLHKQHQINTKNLFISTLADWQACQPNLEMSFLGQKNYYWLHELGLDAKSKLNVYKYLANYHGPHHILIFVSSEDLASIQTGQNGSVVNLSATNSSKDLSSLVRLIPKANYLRITNFIKKIQEQLAIQLTLDQYCILIQYGLLVRDLDEFDLKWVYQVIGLEQSLFDLSKHFLFRDSAAFYKSWSNLSASYADQFWVMFFSEQLFRAYWFIIYQQAQDFRFAKQIGFRLSFDFMKSGWRYLDPNILIKAHDYLYQIDHQLKNNGSNILLDLFFNKFFKNDF
jgi:hypothetical protein